MEERIRKALEGAMMQTAMLAGAVAIVLRRYRGSLRPIATPRLGIIPLSLIGFDSTREVGVDGKT